MAVKKFKKVEEITDPKREWWKFWDETWNSGKHTLSEDEKAAINGYYNLVVGNKDAEMDFLATVFNPNTEVRSDWRLKLLDFYKNITIKKQKQ